MKKLFVVAVLAALPFTASAEGFYVQGDLGASNLRVDTTVAGDFPNKTVFDQKISVGYDFNRFRVAADYTHFGNAKFNDDLSIKTQSFGVTGFYDFHNHSSFTPYVGLRLGYTKAKLSDPDLQGRSSSGSVGILGGTQMKLTDTLGLNLGLEYNRLASDLGQFGGKVGLRYNF
ncbi:opacity family porin [Neisseria sp. ZJ106]|uniref:Outer membrane beta-barrel protein n=1 Tax=Neisseria lisongii TaxID=2912188 RepID=A0ABY7RIR3_9NEIS|nr:opacity family porin [Neisseria lisongii]MCF7521979.1 opacity family porin [Neisseria lisongii]WCL71353.1 outer membrane beta-barrel protein [Neisseria lisongii]